MEAEFQRTFVMVKPDGVERGVIGEVISRLERKGLKIVGMKMLKIGEELAKNHYAEHKEKPFFDSLVAYITSGPVVAMVVEGKEAIRVVRTLVGATNPVDASPGTIRGDFGMDLGRNIIHASDGKETAEYEINLWFKREEICDYKRIDEVWLTE